MRVQQFLSEFCVRRAAYEASGWRLFGSPLITSKREVRLPFRKLSSEWFSRNAPADTKSWLLKSNRLGVMRSDKREVRLHLRNFSSDWFAKQTVIIGNFYQPQLYTFPVQSVRKPETFQFILCVAGEPDDYGKPKTKCIKWNPRTLMTSYLGGLVERRCSRRATKVRRRVVQEIASIASRYKCFRMAFSWTLMVNPTFLNAYFTTLRPIRSECRAHPWKW